MVLRYEATDSTDIRQADEYYDDFETYDRRQIDIFEREKSPIVVYDANGSPFHSDRSIGFKGKNGPTT